jgi:SAM-dependent methyltransferase
MSKANTISEDPIYKLSRIITRIFRWKLDAPPVSEIHPIGFSEKQKHYAVAVNIFIATTKIKSVVELGCGDFRVGRMIARSGVRYTGVDGEESVIARNRELYQKRKVRFYARDVIQDELPDGDLCLVGELFQHLSNSEIRLALLKLRKKYKYIVVTDYQPPYDKLIPNRDLSHDRSTRIHRDSGLDLRKPPFNMQNVGILGIYPVENYLYNYGERICIFLIPMEDQAKRLDPVYLD